MPTVLRHGPYRFFFYAGDKGEPKHVHIEEDDKTAKFWLDPIRLQRSSGFSRVELNKLEFVIQENQAKLMGAWDEYFGD